MTRLEKLKFIYSNSGLSELLHIRKEDDYPDKNYSSLRFASNDYRLRAIEIWENTQGEFFRIYHSEKIENEIKVTINNITGKLRSTIQYTDFKGDYQTISNDLYTLLNSDGIKEIAKNNPVLTRNSSYEGLALPDVDVSDIEVLGRVFTWKEIIAINEDLSADNKLKIVLSNYGVYLQRSKDGKSRYVGSAYSEGGILARWLKHLTSNGHAKHLNLYVLENGYSDILFTVLEFTTREHALEVENRWKLTLGTRNSAGYDGLQLNNN